MTETAAEARRRAAERALATGEVPLDPYPGYLSWFVRECVERGAASGLDWLCRTFPEREAHILERWCRLACKGRHLWAWREARDRLEGLVARGEDIPAPLARFAIEAAPAPARGPAPEGSRAVLTDFMMRVLEENGLAPREVNRQFGESFPSPRQDPGTTLRKRRRRGRPFVAPAFEPSNGAESDPSPPARPLALDVDWTNCDDAVVTLLRSRWPAFALMWEFWPEHRDAHVELWCGRAGREAWVWDELRALLDHAIYCGCFLVPRLRAFIAVPRPANPPGRPVEHGRWLRVAAIEARFAEVMRSQRAAECVVASVFARLHRLRDEDKLEGSWPDLGLDLDTSTVGKHFVSGREQLQGVVACTLA